MNTYQVWLPGWREFDGVIYGTTTDRMAVLAQLRQHAGRTRYVSVWKDGNIAGYKVFHAGQDATLEDFS